MEVHSESIFCSSKAKLEDGSESYVQATPDASIYEPALPYINMLPLNYPPKTVPDAEEETGLVNVV